MSGGLPVEQIGPDIHRHVAHVVGACFGIPHDESLRRWCDVLMAEPHRTTYAAFDGWTIVAVSSMVVGGGGAERDVAVLSGAATLPEWRGRGLYAGMVARRLEDAARLGVRTIHAEIAVGPGTDRDGAAAAARVLRRLGFEQASSLPGGVGGPAEGRISLSRIEP